MSELQFISVVGIPVTVLLVGVTLIAIARPDPDDGPYAAYLAAASFGFHQRRRTELLAEAPEGGTVDRIDRAYRGAVCFAMVSLGIVAALVAGAAGYNFIAQPIAGGDGDRIRDLAMGSLLAYGGLVLVAGLVFRANFWAIRGNDEAAEDVAPSELGDA